MVKEMRLNKWRNIISLNVSLRPLLLALLLLLSSLLSLISPQLVSAASIYDDVYRTTDEIVLNGNGNGCDMLDVSLDWSLWITDPSKWYPGNNHNDIKESFENAVSDGGSWGVSYNYDENLPYIYWRENTQIDLTWTTGAVVSTQVDHIATIQCYGGNNYYLDMNFDGTYVTVSTDGVNSAGTKNYFISNANPNYPIGYEGEQISENVDYKIPVKPDFTYIVNNKDVSATDYGRDLPTYTPDEGYIFNGYSVEWTLFKCSTYDNDNNSCGDPQVVNYQILPQEQNYNYSVSDYADYHLQANYLVQECYPFGNDNPVDDYCYYVDLGTKFEEYDFTSTTVYLPIDGSSIIGDTRDGECDTSGFCEPPSPYEDCTTYGLDIIGGFICIMNNFRIWVVETLKYLFLPSPKFFADNLQSFVSKLQNQMGFVYTAFSFLVSWIGTIVDITPRCQFDFGDGNFFGANPEVNLCYFEQTAPNIWNIGITFTRLLFAATLVFIAYRRLMQILEGLGT